MNELTELEKLNDVVNNALAVISGKAELVRRASRMSVFHGDLDSIQHQIKRASKALKEYTQKQKDK